MKEVEVVAAVFIKDKEVFCAQRENKGPLALKWEFPGGKIEVNETKERALIREIKEELNTDISIGEFIMTVNHQYETFKLVMHVFLCQIINGNLDLHEHVNSCWARKEALDSLDWAEADLAIVKKVKELL